ncbi:MAG: CxxxxCH/CxxCH domain-containing protein, partial [Polyangiaceae bacterium]|nr:CxxxxCH/CxxCH domain-containing protein [Polyangiaceae bacterium]
MASAAYGPFGSRGWHALLLALAVSVGCLEPKQQPRPAERDCTACHGSPSRAGDATAKAAPPFDLDGHTSPRYSGVGAHRAHLFDTKTHAAVECEQCHTVPDEVYSKGHVDTRPPAEVEFGTLARRGNHKPRYDRAQGTCADTYCHRDSDARWTRPRSDDDACGSCHGLPPQEPHPQNENCQQCHDAVIDADREFVRASLHVNGQVDLSSDCGTCHGTGEDGAPPPDLSGSSRASSRGVGAHPSHLQASDTHGAVACRTCHLVPDDVDSKGHLDGDGRAEVRFVSLAVADGSQPRYDQDRLSCSGTYCHGTADPRWTKPRSSEDACGSCHGLPPPPPHTQNDQCSECHGSVIDEDRKFIRPERHVDGKVDVGKLGCDGCHGSGQSGAPPPDLERHTRVSFPGVGAHALHLGGSSTHGPVACDQCHAVPDSVDSKGHIDDERPADVTFGDLARLGKLNPLWSDQGLTCSGTYCHGSAAPVWTQPRSSDDACGTCHGLPPPEPHPQRQDCSVCHAEVIDQDRHFVRPELHVDGQVEVSSMPCNACHGTGADGAPPPDVAGNTAVSAPGVGAHAVHLKAGADHAPLACDQCHTVPDSVDSPRHVDDTRPADVAFGDLARLGNLDPLWSDQELTCSGTYCHGSAAPVWNEPRSTSDACGTCHGLPPPPPHPERQDCSVCHGKVIGKDRHFLRPELHVDGQVEVGSMPCNACHGNGADGAPPPDVAGNTAVSAPGVGAHALHLGASADHAPVACDQCHTVPDSVDSPGHIDDTRPADIAFGDLARQGNLDPLWDSQDLTCAETYCHGAAAPVWNEPRSTSDACGTCHGLPPPAPHPQRQDCSVCHGRVIDTHGHFVRPELHVNGKVEAGAMACDACHGTGPLGAPPADLAGNTAVSAPGVGAHAIHLGAAADHGPVACWECHTIPDSIDTPGHIDDARPADVAFGQLATHGGAEPSYAVSTRTCSGTYCHGAATPAWNEPRSASEACGTCHGLPPPAPHPQRQDCSVCHAEVMDTDRHFVRPELHVDGQIELGSMPCNACHGTEALGAPPADLAGNTAPSAPGVGAHPAHLGAAADHAPVACDQCHTVPDSVDSPGHIDDLRPADVVFGDLATQGGAEPSYNVAVRTCSGTYCHGSETPVWTAPRSSSDACGTCHGLPPPSPHPQRQDCSVCHGDVIAQDGTFLRPELHIDGQVEVGSMPCNACHGTAADGAPPPDVAGNTTVVAPGVGAHALHLGAAADHGPVACDQCHPVPSSVDSPGHLDTERPADIVFGELATLDDANPTYTA